MSVVLTEKSLLLTTLFFFQQTAVIQDNVPMAKLLLELGAGKIWNI
jgi:hypothetical protein